jgi:uncharacterized cofD-like protein
LVRNRAEQPKIVVIGGGTGLSVLLRGLKNQPLDITAIVTVADDGGSSGILRNELQIPPPGDVRNVLIALADVEPLLSEMLQYRFSNGTGLAGHSLGNLILAAMTDISGDFVNGIRELSRVLAVRGRVLPASAKSIVLMAETDNNTIVIGESKIPKPGRKIKRLFLEPADIEPLPEALQAIEEADAILVGPGSLYTSILPNLLVPGMARAIHNAAALKLFVCNVMTQPGETDHFTASQHVQTIYDHIGFKLFDYIIVNNGEIPPAVLSKYAEQGAEPVRLDEPELNRLGCRIIQDQLVLYQTYLRHDAEKLSRQIYGLVSGWLNGKR